MQPGDAFTDSRNYLTIRTSGTSQALRFYTQIFSQESAPEIKAANYHEAERIALNAQEQILGDVGLVKHLPLVRAQIDAFNGNIDNSGSDNAMNVLPKEFVKTDRAMNTPGGIDLNTSNGMKWQFTKDGKGVVMDIDPAMIARFKAHGIDRLSPFIISVTPVASIWALAGLARI